jgi:integrase/recombinase XerC
MSPLCADFGDYLQHARVQQRLSPRTLQLYTDGLERLQRMLADAAIDVRALTLAQARRLAALLHRRASRPSPSRCCCRSGAAATAGWGCRAACR